MLVSKASALSADIFGANITAENAVYLFRACIRIEFFDKFDSLVDGDCEMCIRDRGWMTG